MNRLEAVVVSVQDDRSYVIDKGSDDDVIVGMRFAILGPDISAGPSLFAPSVKGTAAPVKQVTKVVDVRATNSTVRIFRGTSDLIDRGLMYFLPTPGAAGVVSSLAVVGRSFLPFPAWVFILLGAAILRYLRDRRNLIPRPGDRVVQIVGDEAQDQVAELPI